MWNYVGINNSSMREVVGPCRKCVGVRVPRKMSFSFLQAATDEDNRTILLPSGFHCTQLLVQQEGHMGGCQNYGPFLDLYYNTAPNI